MTRFVVAPSGPLAGTLTVPGDKSIGHRALLFGLLSEAPVEVFGLGDGADNGRSAKAIQMLGARVERDGARIVITGRGLGNWTAPTSAIDCGNSGTTIRMLLGLLAPQPFATTLIGDDSLSRRPMKRVIAPLRAMGATITGTSTGAGTADDIVPPLLVGGGGRLRGMAHALAIASAQVKTALVLAGLSADGVTTVTEPGPSRDHSERMLAYLGAPITTDGRRVTVDPRQWDGKLRGGRVDVPADPSSAAFAVVAAVVAGTTSEVRIRDVMVNPTRTGFLDVLAAMGANIQVVPTRQAGPEPLADLVVGPTAGLRGTQVAGDLVVRAIDELPIIAVAAALAHGETVVREADELRVKESDRIVATLAMLRSFGVACQELPDGFVVQGCAGRLPHAGNVDAMADHRIAMAGAIAGLCAPGSTVIHDADNVATSYPGFVAAMNSLGATMAVQ